MLLVPSATTVLPTGTRVRIRILLLDISTQVGTSRVLLVFEQVTEVGKSGHWQLQLHPKLVGTRFYASLRDQHNSEHSSFLTVGLPPPPFLALHPCFHEYLLALQKYILKHLTPNLQVLARLFPP